MQKRPSHQQKRNTNTNFIKPIKGIQVEKKSDDEPFEKMLRRFQKKVTKSRILKECISRMKYEKPSDRKRREKKQNIARLKKKALKEEMEKKLNPTNENYSNDKKSNTNSNYKKRGE